MLSRSALGSIASESAGGKGGGRWCGGGGKCGGGGRRGGGDVEASGAVAGVLDVAFSFEGEVLLVLGEAVEGAVAEVAVFVLLVGVAEVELLVFFSCWLFCMRCSKVAFSFANFCCCSVLRTCEMAVYKLSCISCKSWRYIALYHCISS